MSRTYWLDKPGNDTRRGRGLCTPSGALLAMDVVVPKHGRTFAVEHTSASTAWFGFIACVVLVLVAKQLRSAPHAAGGLL